MMNSLNYFYNMSAEQVSVEVNSDGFVLLEDDYQSSFDEDVTYLFNMDPFASDFPVSGTCDSADLVDSMNRPIEANEFDKYLGPNPPANSTSDIDQNLLAINSLPASNINQNKKIRVTKKPISLSSSVGIGVPQRFLKPSHKIEIMVELEENYRPRYKSDYFGQNGKIRKPRYVCDRKGNHYITLKVPIDVRGQIRVDWVTIPNENGDRYVMPYRFQTDNDSAEAIDCNPYFANIVHDGTGLMKLYLVLIKAKQDALKSLQPLQPYQPIKNILGIVDKYSSTKVTTLTPKKLIQKYQLGKSQLAFTLCTLSTNGQSYIPEWDTTIYSTTIEEEANEKASEKTVACPKCSFEIPVSEDGVMVEEVTTSKRKSLEIKVAKPKTIKKLKRLTGMIYCVN